MFQYTFNFGRDSFKMDTFPQSQHKNLYAHSFYFVCPTRFTQRFNINWRIRKILLAVQIMKHLIVQSSAILFSSYLSAKYKNVFWNYSAVFLYSASIRIFETNFFVAGYM